MVRPRITLGISGLFLFLTIQITAQTVSKPSSAGTATVSGRVVLNGEPMVGVTVRLQRQQSDLPSTSALRAKTDENGRYHITGIARGRYSVIALAPGYIRTGDVEYGPRGKTVNVAEGENVENIDIELKRGGVITGRVTDSDRFSQYGEVDVLGKFVIENLIPGEYEVYVYSTQSVNHDEDEHAFMMITSSKKKVFVSGDNQPPVIIDFNQKEKER
jgi:hypothetical protein